MADLEMAPRRRAEAPQGLTPARLQQLLSEVADALQRDAQAAASAPAAHEQDCSDRFTAHSAPKFHDLHSACQVPDGQAAAARGAGRRVALPWPSAEVGAALDGLARTIMTGCAVDNAIPAASLALSTVMLIVDMAPQNFAVIAGHGALMQSLGVALGTRTAGRELWLEAALNAALDLLAGASWPAAAAAAWRRGSESAANLHALAGALARVFALPEVANGSEGAFSEDSAKFEEGVCTALAAAIKACPDAPGLCAALAWPSAEVGAALAAHAGFVDALSRCVARGAARIPAVGANPSGAAQQQRARPRRGALHRRRHRGGLRRAAGGCVVRHPAGAPAAGAARARAAAPGAGGVARPAQPHRRPLGGLRAVVPRGCRGAWAWGR